MLDREEAGSISKSNRCLASRVLVLLLLANVLASISDSSADPMFLDNGDGTMTALWDLSNPANFTTQNVTFGLGNVTLQIIPSQFVDTSQGDFQQGTTLLNVDLTSDPGNVTLNDTTSAGTPGFAEIGIDEGNGIDAFIDASGGGNKNYGASDVLTVESTDPNPKRILIQFDLSLFGNLDLVTQAMLRMNLENADTANPVNISVYQVMASWVEGINDGNPGSGVTWQDRESGVVAWTTPGGDFNATPEYVLTGVTNQTVNHLWDITTLVDDWMAGRRINYGVILMAEDQPYVQSLKEFNSKEWGSPGRRPRLRVDYVSAEGGYANGSFVSRIIDGQTQVNWGNISWNYSQPSQTTLTIHTRSGDCLGSWNSWSPAYISPTGSQITSPSARCLQYKVEMDTLNITKTPVLEEVRIDYWKYAPQGVLRTQNLAPSNWVGWDVFDASFSTPVDTDITFSYSTDSGMSWIPVSPGESLQLVSSPMIMFSANLSTLDSTLTPVLHNMTMVYAFYGSLDHIHMAQATWTGTSDEWVDLDAIGHDIFHHETPFTQKWETDDPWGSVNSTGLYTPGKVGTWRVYCNNSDDSISNFTTVNVLPGGISSIGIAPWDPGTMSTDDTLLLNVSSFDADGNEIGPVIANWSVSGGIGAITPGPSSSAMFDPTKPGMGTIAADDGIGHSNATNNIQVVVGSRSSVSIEPWSPGTLTADESQDFTAYEHDADGNQIGSATVTWAVSGGIGTVTAGPSDTSTFQATTVGTGYVTIDDGLGHANTTDAITVVAGVLDSITVSPSLAVIEHLEYQDFTATGYDSDGNTVPIVSSVWNSNAGTVVYSGAQNATLRVQDTSLIDGWIRITATSQNNVSGYANVSVVVTNVNPTILGTIPNQQRPEDYGSWTLDLSSYASDIQDPVSSMTWFFTDHDESLTTISGDNVVGNHVITFTTVRNAFGSDELTIWLRDSDGFTDKQTMFVNITSVNDRPTIQSITPFTIHYDDPYTYYFYDYVSDVETAKQDLVLTSNDAAHITFDGLWGTFTYPEEALGDTVYPVITVHDEDGAEMSTVVAITISDDYVPVLSVELPDVVLYEGEQVTGYFDLDDYFTDPDEDSLFYTNGNVHVEITINADHTVDFLAPMDWNGQETVTFRAIDPMNARAEDIVLITVLPVNDPPTISGVPDLVVHYDDPARPDYNYTFDLAPYIHDVDNVTSDLIVSTDDPGHIFFWGVTTVMFIHYPMNMSGETVVVRITVSDGIEETSDDINITILDDWPPETSLVIPDISFYEDVGLDDAFKISDFFSDPEGNELSYSVFSTNVIVSIDQLTDLVSFDSNENWSGVEFVTFRATDVYGAIGEQTIEVTVIPVNDAPYVLMINEMTLSKGQTYTLDLMAYIIDSDNDFSELTISVTGNVAGRPSLAGNMIILSYDQKGRDYVRLEVSDGIATTYASFHVVIVSPPPPTIWEQIYWPWSVITIVLLCAILIPFLRWFFAKILIDEVFLIHKSGTLISHWVLNQETYVDEDVFSSMFTAIQAFIRDSFREVEDAPVKRIDFGSQKIMIERGKYLYLAVVYRGHETRKNVRPLREAIEEIERTRENELKDWNGLLAGFAGVQQILNKHLGELDTACDLDAESSGDIVSEIETAQNIDEPVGRAGKKGGSK